MALYIPHSIFYLARLLYVRPETFGPYYIINILYLQDFPIEAEEQNITKTQLSPGNTEN